MKGMQHEAYPNHYHVSSRSHLQRRSLLAEQLWHSDGAKSAVLIASAQIPSLMTRVSLAEASCGSGLVRILAKTYCVPVKLVW
jgi:hypothetical protein